MTNFTPTRDQVEAAARAANVELRFIDGQLVRLDSANGYDWTPWLPGTDCMELMAALGVNGPEVRFYVFTTHLSFQARGFLTMVDHDNTTKSKAAALAQAVFLCAAKVGGWRE